MCKSSCHSEPLCQQNKPLVKRLETVFGIDRESRERQWHNSSNRSKLSRGSSAVSIQSRLFNHSIRELSHPSPMDGFIASVRSGVNEGKVVGFKEAFRWLCVYALFKQLLMRFLIRFCKERRTERLRLTNLHDFYYAWKVYKKSVHW